MTLKQFKKSVLKNISDCPKHWRKGQKVFNYIDEKYNVARAVQAKGIDCFYDDTNIGVFIRESFKLIK